MPRSDEEGLGQVVHAAGSSLGVTETSPRRHGDQPKASRRPAQGDTETSPRRHGDQPKASRRPAQGPVALSLSSVRGPCIAVQCFLIEQA